MKEEIKDKLTDLYKILTIVLVIVAFVGMFFLPEKIANIIVYGGIACLNIWVIVRIIARYKNMNRSQRQSVLYYFLFLGLGIIHAYLVYNGWLDSWVKDENLSSLLSPMGACFIGTAFGFGLNACKKDEEE